MPLETILLIAVLVAVLAVLLVLLLRRPVATLPPEWVERMLQQERQQLAAQQHTQQALARSDGALAHLSHNLLQQMRDLNQTSQGSMDGFRQALDGRLVHIEASLAQRFGALAATHQQQAEQLRATMNERLARIQQDNQAQLEAMRRTVDEKLHATLEQRLGESFKLVSDRLEQVHQGLGEMQTLAGSVGDLKRVMTNVKTRGTWGELQLGAIIDNVLTTDQYAKNVKTVPGSDDLVEFAVRLPGRSGDAPVWLPIDSKYPVEHYQRLLDAHEAADKAAIASAGNAFESSIRLEARKIRNKYVAPPHTTDFALLYLPSEGLFAEALRRPGLAEALQNDCRVMLAGPANLAALLNSLQMGFKTLAIEKRSSEVWAVLGQVKTEFHKFGEVVEATRKSIDAAAKRFEQVDVRTRAIQRRLSGVHELPAPDQAEDGPEAAETPKDGPQ
ncbi:MAG: DNA recombination protein RmuC [Comamonas sp.]